MYMLAHAHADAQAQLVLPLDGKLMLGTARTSSASMATTSAVTAGYCSACSRVLR